MANDNYSLLIEKLDQFIRKYYVNQMIRGTLYSLGLILLLFLLFNALEYFFYFGTTVRKVFFFSFILISAAALVKWVFVSLMHYFRLGKVISHEQAATIIGTHFINVQDKLLNILQLRHQADQLDNKALVLASIDQKSEEIKLVPFKTAIDLRKNRKYLRYALPPLLLLLVILLAAPSVIKDSTTRIIKNNEEFERPAPFHFVITNENLEVIQYEDYTLEVDIDGDVEPEEAFINIDNYQYRLKENEEGNFTYTFSKVQKNTEFHLFSGSVESRPYELNVLAKPNIVGFEVKLDYPNYLGRKDEALENTGDLVVPEGTAISWILDADYTDELQVKFGQDEQTSAERVGEDLFSFKKRVRNGQQYTIYYSNREVKRADSVTYSLTVVPDLYPNINVEKFVDSTRLKELYFVGEASDDHGLSQLTFNYRIRQEGEAESELQTVNLPKPTSKQIQYRHEWDLNQLELQPGDEVIYYFEIFDNDAVNGRKSARTNLMRFAKPTVEEFRKMEDDNNEEINKNLSDALDETRELKDELRKLREKLLQKKEMDWQTRKELEKLTERQKKLEKKIKEAQKDFEQNLENQEEFSKPSEEIQEKQEKMKEMFDELLNDEMKEVMDQISELLQELNKEEALEKIEEMDLNEEEMEMELERMKELLEKLQMEYEMEQQIDQLNELAEKQEALSEETKEESKEQEALEEEQKKIEEEFEKLGDRQEELEKKNEQMKDPMPMEDSKEVQEQIKQDMKQSLEQLQQNMNNNASKKQKDAAQKMRDMASQMQQSMQSGQMAQMQEDMESLRQLLENLITVSFDQEEVMDNIGETTVNTPRYVTLTQEQFKLQDDFTLIEDSLHALSKRVFQIQSFVTEKVTEVKSNMRSSLKDLEERRKPQAMEQQQRAMTNINDLALMLSEVMEQMQQQMSSQMGGAQMCQKPGNSGGQVPMDKITQGQKEVSEEMKKMGQQRGKGEEGKGGDAKEFAKMAAKQAALRKALREKQKQLQEQGKGSKELQNILDQMNENEIDLVNKRITNETLRRQQDIITRLLEAERAERERGFDNKRQSESGEEIERKVPPAMEEYIKQRESEVEMFKRVSPALKPYYKQLVDEYYRALKGE